MWCVESSPESYPQPSLIQRMFWKWVVLSISYRHTPPCFLTGNNIQIMKVCECNVHCVCELVYNLSATKTLHPLVDFPLVGMRSKVELIVETRFSVIKQKKNLGSDTFEFHFSLKIFLVLSVIKNWEAASSVQVHSLRIISERVMLSVNLISENNDGNISVRHDTLGRLIGNNRETASLNPLWSKARK